MSTRLSSTKPRGQLFPSRCPPGYPQQSQEVSSFPADVHQAILNKAKRSALSQQMSTRLSLTKPRGQLFPSRCPPGYPQQSQEVSSFPADVHQAILIKAKRSALSQQMSTRLSLTKPRGQLFPSRCPPGYPRQSQEVSSFPADVHQAILDKAKRSALSQQMSTRLSLTKPRGQLFPSRCPPGYPSQSQEVSSFPADVHQAILDKVKRSALSQQMSTRLSLTKPRGQLFPSRCPPGYP